jgi:hypothetical protein
MAPKKNRKVHGKAIAYADARDARIAANAVEKEAHDTLLYAMLEEGLSTYEYGELKVTVDEKLKCRVTQEAGKNGKAEPDAEEGGGNGEAD